MRVSHFWTTCSSAGEHSASRIGAMLLPWSTVGVRQWDRFIHHVQWISRASSRALFVSTQRVRSLADGIRAIRQLVMGWTMYKRFKEISDMALAAESRCLAELLNSSLHLVLKRNGCHPTPGTHARQPTSPTPAVADTDTAFRFPVDRRQESCETQRSLQSAGTAHNAKSHTDIQAALLALQPPALTKDEVEECACVPASRSRASHPPSCHTQLFLHSLVRRHEKLDDRHTVMDPGMSR